MSYKLYYFNVRGLGETIRLIFAAAGQEYEDFRFEKEDWPNHKPKSPSGQAPFLSIPSGEVLVQSKAIYRYLGNTFDLYGTTAQEKYTIDALSDTLADLFMDFITIKFMADDNAEKAKKFEEYFDVKAPRYLGLIQKLAGDAQPGTLVGGKLSWVDLHLTAVMYAMEHAGPEAEALVKKYPSLLAHAAAVSALPKVAAYLATRPATSM